MTSNHIILAGTAFLLLAGAIGSAEPPAAGSKTGFEVREEVLSPMVGVGAYGIKDGGKHFIYTSRKDGKLRVYVDGKPGPEHSGVLWGNAFSLSEDGRHSFYGVLEAGKAFVVIDGQPGPSFDALGEPVPSPDGERLAYGALKGKVQVVVCDGREGPEMDEVEPPFFSPDSKRTAFKASRRTPGAVSWSAVVDGAEWPGDSYRIEEMCFSPDSKHLAYLSLENRFSESLFDSHGKGRCRVVLDGRPGPEFEWIHFEAGKAFQPDGSLMYLGMREKLLHRVRHVPAAR